MGSLCSPEKSCLLCHGEGSKSAMRMKRRLFFPTFFVVASTFAQMSPQNSAANKHPFTFEDMMKLKRVGAPVPSPDGKWVVFDCEDVDLEANTKISHLWIVPANGGESKRLNETPNHEERPRFSPDSKRLIWTSKATDPTQIWMCDFDTESGTLTGKPHQVTSISTGADGGIWSPDGKNIVFVSEVYPDCADDACNKKRDEELKKSKVKAKIFTRLFYRHWNAFTEFKRSHLFVQSVDATVSSTDILSVGPAGVPPAESATAGQRPVLRQQPRDLTPGDHDVPPFHLGGQDMYAISPDGQELAYTCKADEVEATSTNSEIFTVPINVGQVSNLPSGNAQVGNLRHAKKISTSPGADTTPLYSPDGKYLAWRSQARAGFEADKWRLLVQDRQSGKIKNLSEKFDRSVGSFCWGTLWGNTIIGLAYEDRGQSFIAGVEPEHDPNIKPMPAWPRGDTHADNLVVIDRTIFYSQQFATAPDEIWHWTMPINHDTYAGAEEPAALTHMNDALLSQIDMQPLESFTFKGANNDDVQGFMSKPPGFDLAKKYPLKFLIHGGPQGAWGNEWTYRWNAELFAASGYVVVMINFHGSTGYGQKFTDSISGDWGGQPFVDLMKGLDYVEKTYPFIDKNREAALGASYGGYMTNWLLGHTNRFKCIVSHDGIFNAESAYGTTEELWFPEWEFKGPPWKNRELYRKWSPHEYAANFKTPTLVVHGQNDYRLDVSQGFDLFTTLQRLKVPSKMLYFPDEGHWVLKPQNSRLWYKTVNDWVDQWCGDGPR
jgi:dipeptidyl aminopeptidase/acylaminoacyl peptidase